MGKIEKPQDPQDPPDPPIHKCEECKTEFQAESWSEYKLFEGGYDYYYYLFCPLCDNENRYKDVNIVVKDGDYHRYDRENISVVHQYINQEELVSKWKNKQKRTFNLFK